MTEQLIEWFRANGGKLHPDVEIAHDETDGYHFRAKDWLDISRPIVYCPLDLTLSAQNIGEAGSHWPQAFISRFQDSSPEVLMRFLLIQEFTQGPRSKWWPYIAILPQPEEETQMPNLDTPLWFSQTESFLLKGSNIEAAVRERERSWQEEYNEGTSLLQSTVDVTQYTWHLYKWAATILSSRCFPSEKPLGHDETCHAPMSSVRSTTHEAIRTRFPVLVPVLDTANHNGSARVVWVIDEKGYTLLMKDRVAPRAQVFNNYGPKGNEELLMGYGFTVANNPHDIFWLSLPFSNPLHKTWVQRLVDQGKQLPFEVSKLQSSVNLKEAPNQSRSDVGQASAMFSLHVDGRAPEALLEYLNLLVANERELKEWQSASGTLVTQGRVLTQAMVQLRKAILKQYRNLCNVDGKLPVAPANTRQRHALRYRDGQRSILHAHITQSTNDLLDRTKTLRLMTIVDIMTVSPGSIKTELRATLRQVIGTRNAFRLKEQGYQDLVFVLFICLTWIKFSPSLDDSSSDSDLSSTASIKTPISDSAASLELLLRRWRLFIGQTYCPPPGCSSSENDSTCRGVNCFCSLTQPVQEKQQPWTLTPTEDEEIEDEQITNTVYSVIQRAFLLAGSNSIFRDERWTKGFIRWAVGIWKAEAVLLPASVLAMNHSSGDKTDETTRDMEDEMEERVLFLEVDDVVDRNSKHVDEPSRKKQKLED